ncbi:hypothetical protein FEM48_Zijuj03G0014700 [Ziziphus jujuba var. spinosa]|uniref:Uncharacterized protein n=1 Tax=Ziziphus jujuba var. spinosa TaxID=714518 RepID=A0A978VMD0_ZIZJJ|nr:hypothetical protein FEM48_Zijuj03G0014700 [Ziziphus jujuba var. spinosa]
MHSAGTWADLRADHNKGKAPYDDETLDRARKICEKFPKIPIAALNLTNDQDIQQLSEAIGAAKTHVEGCSSFLKAAIK